MKRRNRSSGGVVSPAGRQVGQGSAGGRRGGGMGGGAASFAAAAAGGPPGSTVARLGSLGRELAARSCGNPRPEFRADLRGRLLAAAAAGPPPSGMDARAALALDWVRGFRGRRTCAGVAAGLAAITVAGVAATAASRSVPGEPLSNLTRATGELLNLAGNPAARGQLELELAAAHLSQIRVLAASGKTARVRTDLGLLAGEERAGAELLEQVAIEDHLAAPLRTLVTDGSAQAAALTALLPVLPAAVQPAAAALEATLIHTVGVAGALLRGTGTGSDRPPSPPGGGTPTAGTGPTATSTPSPSPSPSPSTQPSPSPSPSPTTTPTPSSSSSGSPPTTSTPSPPPSSPAGSTPTGPPPSGSAPSGSTPSGSPSGSPSDSAAAATGLLSLWGCALLPSCPPPLTP